MSENEKTVAVPEKTKSSAGGFKEWGRKKIVNIKRKPQNIALLYFAIVTVYNLLTLTVYSEAIIMYAKDVEWVGLMVFINTLFSILMLVAYMNTFPKLKKPGSKTVLTLTESGIKLHINIIMLVVTIVMIVCMIVCEGVYYNLMNANYIEQYVNKPDMAGTEAAILIKNSLTFSVTHIILLGVGLVLLLTLPLYRKLIMKINTRKELESTAESMKAIEIED